MIDYEAELFEVAPWCKNVMLKAKELNNGAFMKGRTGWVRREIENPESIYEHSCKVALATHYLFGDFGAVSQAVIHDFAEIYEPDYTPGEIEPEEKKRKELIAMQSLSGVLPEGEIWFAIWQDYEKKDGAAKYIWELDKMCPAIQAINYARQNVGSNLDEFYPNARSKIQTPELVDLLDEMCKDNVPQSKDAYEVYFSRLRQINL